MKPKAPKKRDTKPNCKSGEVKVSKPKCLYSTTFKIPICKQTNNIVSIVFWDGREWIKI